MTDARRIVDAGWPEDKDKHKSSPIKDKIMKARQSRKKNWEKRIDELARLIYDDLKVEESIIDAAKNGMAKKIWYFTESKTFCEKIRMKQDPDDEYTKEIFTQLNLKKEYERYLGSFIDDIETENYFDFDICFQMGFVELVNNIEITPKHIISRLEEIFNQNGIDPIKIKERKFHLDEEDPQYQSISNEVCVASDGRISSEEASKKLSKSKLYESIEYVF